MKKIILFFSFVFLFAKPLIIKDYIFNVAMQGDKIFILSNYGLKIFKNYKLYKHYKNIDASNHIQVYKNLVAVDDANVLYLIDYKKGTIKHISFKKYITDIKFYDGFVFVATYGGIYKYDLNLNFIAKRVISKKPAPFKLRVKEHFVIVWYKNRVKVFSDEFYNHNIFDDEFYMIACKKPTILVSYWFYQQKTHLVFVEPKIENVDYYSDFDDYLIINLGGEVVVTSFQSSYKLHIPIKGYADYLGNIDDRFYFVAENFDNDTNTLFEIIFGGLSSSIKYLKKVPFSKGFVQEGRIVGFDSHHVWIDGKLVIKSIDEK